MQEILNLAQKIPKLPIKQVKFLKNRKNVFLADDVYSWSREKK